METLLKNYNGKGMSVMFRSRICVHQPRASLSAFLLHWKITYEIKSEVDIKSEGKTREVNSR